MNAARPAKVSDRVESEIADLLFALPSYLEPTDPRIVAWTDEVTKAMVAGRSAAFLTLAAITHLTGDVDGAERFLVRAEAAGAHPMAVEAQRMPLYSNLGYFTKALDACRRVLSIKAKNITVGLPMAVGAGGFTLAADLLEQARLANLNLEGVDQIEQFRSIVEGARMLNLSDDEYARALDVAGEVLRSRRLFWLEVAPRVSYDEEMQCIGVRYRIAVTPEEASILTGEFFDRLLASGLDSTPLTVRFIGTRTADALAAGS